MFGLNVCVDCVGSSWDRFGVVCVCGGDGVWWLCVVVWCGMVVECVWVCAVVSGRGVFGAVVVECLGQGGHGGMCWVCGRRVVVGSCFGCGGGSCGGDGIGFRGERERC